MVDANNINRRTVLKTLGGATAALAGTGTALAGDDVGIQDRTECTTTWSKQDLCSSIHFSQLGSSTFEVTFDFRNDSNTSTTVEFGTTQNYEVSELDRATTLAPDEQHSETIQVESGEENWGVYVHGDGSGCLEYAAVRECEPVM